MGCIFEHFFFKPLASIFSGGRVDTLPDENALYRVWFMGQLFLINNVFYVGQSLKLYENIQVVERVEGFDNICVLLMVKFLLNKPIRQRPGLQLQYRHDRNSLYRLTGRRLRTERQQLSVSEESFNSS